MYPDDPASALVRPGGLSHSGLTAAAFDRRTGVARFSRRHTAQARSFVEHCVADAVCRSFVQACSMHSIMRSRTIRPTERRRDEPPAIGRVMHRRGFPQRGVPLPVPGVRGLGGRSGLPSVVRRRSWGSMPFAGLLPRTGGCRISAAPGPRACSRLAAPPDNFRRVDSPPVKRRESDLNRAVNPGL